jgi:hypothetical protein
MSAILSAQTSDDSLRNNKETEMFHTSTIFVKRRISKLKPATGAAQAPHSSFAVDSRQHLNGRVRPIGLCA